MENANEKVLAKSQLYNIAKFRKVMIIIGIIAFIGTLVVGICITNLYTSHYIEDCTERADLRYRVYQGYFVEYTEESWLQDNYNSAEEYADYYMGLKDPLYPDSLEKLKEGRDAYVNGYIDYCLEELGFFEKHFEPGYIIIGIFPFLFFAAIGQVVYLAFRNISIAVTDKRITGRALFGRQVELPCNQVSSISMGLLKSVAIATSSGKIHFYLIKNRDEIFKTVSTLLKEKQDIPAVEIPKPTSSQSTEADELAKYKSLLDSGAITQEEYDAKKKQILGL